MTFISRFLELLLCLSLSAPALAATDGYAGTPSEEKRIPFWSIITDIPDTSWYGLKMAFSKDALPAWGIIAGSTALLWHYDQDILNDVQAKGRSWGLGNTVNYTSWLQIGGTSYFDGPKDTAGLLYFLGDGFIPIGVGVGMIGTGYFGDKTRAWNTGIEMMNALIVGGIFDQAVKHMVGRESPSRSTTDGGAVRPFPNIRNYSKDTARYDAMPSGHIMAATIMFTVLEEEYSEYNHIFYPLEVAWLGVLGFGMINVSVHWASDYPLGIGMGYLFGKSAVAIHHPEKYKTMSKWQFLPQVDPATGVPLVGALYSW